MTSEHPLLAARNISVTVGSTQLLNGVDISVPHASIVALLGPNGAGKTTLMHALVGLNAVDATTTISFDNKIISHWKPHKRVEHGLVFLPQHSTLFKSLSVAENLDVVFDYHHYWQTKDRSEFLRSRDELLDLIGLRSILDRQAGVLSGGQKRKLELARALLMQPRLIICDEPFAGVDPKSISELSAAFSSICSEKGISVLISDHNVEELMNIASYFYVVLDGSVVTQGCLEEIVKDPVTSSRYFGSTFSHAIKKRFLP